MQTNVSQKSRTFMSNLELSSRLSGVNDRISTACERNQRNPNSVQLLAVSKTKPLSMLEQAYQAGQRHFAENYVQEGVSKRQIWPYPDTTWHFIGPLQSNKTRSVAEHFDWVHTVDRLKIAQRLSDQRPTDLPALNVLIQVNISQDDAKSGVEINAAGDLADQIATLPNMHLRGLMAIPAVDLTDQQLTKQYLQLKSLRDTLMKKHSECTELSIGMSGDFEVAIACGATMVRIGSDIFGARNS